MSEAISTETTVPVLDPVAIKEVLQPGPPRWWGILGSYLRIQTGTTREWLAIWALQNVRYCPVYILPILTGRLIDRIDRSNPGRVLGEIPWIIGVTALLCLITVAANTGANVMLSRLRRSFTAGLRAALMRRINRLAFTFHDRAQFGMLQNKFTLDAGRLEGFQTFFAESILMYGTVVLVMLVVIAWTNPVLLAVLMIAVPLHLLLVRVFWNRIQNLNEEYRTAETGFLAMLTEALQGMRLTRAHATEDFIDKRVSGAAGEVASKAMRLDLVSNLFGSGGWAVSTFLSVAVMVLGVALAVMPAMHLEVLGLTLNLHPITIGEITILVSYYAIIAGALSAIVGGMPAVAAAQDAITSLSQLYHHDDEEDNKGKCRVERLTGDVEFKDVHFTYPSAERECLNGLTLHIPAGSSLALVGSSGSGKSTIASMLLGFYQPRAGCILIDGRDLIELDRISLRHHIGVVSQDVVLFQDSIVNNIAWGDARPDLARAIAAAERANAMEFITGLSCGIHHVLAERGGNLSGGQRQRLAIARALYRDPRLLILDEATSALDQESERLVQQALDEVRRGRSTLIIAHRLSTVRSADRICVLAEGRVVQSGGFDELMTQDGPFRQLAQGQLV